VREASDELFGDHRTNRRGGRWPASVY
jgi:hypothetical protein